MKWRVWFEDPSVNGDDVIPALQCAMPSDVEGETAEDAAATCARIHGFRGDAMRQVYVCVPATAVKRVVLRKNTQPTYTVAS